MITLRKPRITKKQKEEIVKAYQDGLTIEDITKKFNVATATIYRIIKKN